MKKLYKWLENNGITYKIVEYGERGYFYNADGVVYDAAQVFIKWDDVGGYYAAAKIAEKIRKYCNKYNYDIFHNAVHCGETFLAIRTAESRDASEAYYFYRDKAVNICDHIIHNFHTQGVNDTALLEAKLRRVMDYYGAKLNRARIRFVA